MNQNINIGIIGLGYWGPNLYRNFSRNNLCNVVSICDSNKSNLSKFENSNTKIKRYVDFKVLINDNNIDAVVIATPVKSHYPIAKYALDNNKHVFIEKPLSDNSLNCKKLIQLSKKNDLILFVDHTFLYTDAVNKIKKINSESNFGKMLYYDSTRINLGLIQDDVNVLWDLAVHDLSILDFLNKDKPILISAVGHKHFKSRPITSAYMTLKYKTNFVAHINVNWLSPVKIRKTILAGSKKMIVYNDLNPSDKISVFNKGVDIIKNEKSSKNLINYKIGDTSQPYLANKEALSEAVENYLLSILNKNTPKTDGNSALRIVKILEAADKSMKLNGKPIRVQL